MSAHKDTAMKRTFLSSGCEAFDMVAEKGGGGTKGGSTEGGTLEKAKRRGHVVVPERGR